MAGKTGRERRTMANSARARRKLLVLVKWEDEAGPSMLDRVVCAGSDEADRIVKAVESALEDEPVCCCCQD